MQDKNLPVVVCALYKFTALEHYQTLRDPVYQQMDNLDILGTLLLAKEGINGTIAGLAQDIDDFLGWLTQQPGLEGLDYKESFTDKPPFKRARVKLKKEIVTMGVEGIDPRHSAGTYVDPAEWNDLIDDPDVILIDTRNDYEVQVGKFENAIDPETTTFREFPEYAKQNLDPRKHKKVAMYCTGGIRCEKSTALLKQRGFEEVYHLKGGILKYLETVPEAETRWQGECFVFDDRVTVNHKLEKGSYDQCHACRLPITDEDKLSVEYQPGVSCPHCFGERTEEDRGRYAERQKQIKLARERGQEHIGPQSVLKSG